jgi:serine/threonine-protein phosphatase CPPED1
MRWFKDRYKGLPRAKVCLLGLCLLAWVSVALGADPGALPAQDWNLRNLERLKVASGRPLTFAVLGDSRDNPAVFEQVLKHLDGDPGLAFAIELGDLVGQGSLEAFGDFLHQVRQNVRLPFLTVLGNHDLEKDRGSWLYRQIFGPEYYAFPVKNHYFIVVNDVEPPGIGEEQWRWLEQELSKSRAYKTRLVFLHIPLFDPRGGENHHCLSAANGRRLAALFRQYRVTHVFAAHIHSYFSGDWDGVPYTITAGGGAPLYGTDPQHYFYHYLKVTLKDDRVQIRVQRVAAAGSE